MSIFARVTFLNPNSWWQRRGGVCDRGENSDNNGYATENDGLSIGGRFIGFF